MPRLNLVDEAHTALGELSKVRKDFNAGKVNIDQAKQHIGFFNATSRALGTAINVEKWYKAKPKPKAVIA